MDCFNLDMIYFSPTFSTQQILKSIARGVGSVARHYDLTPYNHGFGEIDVTGDDLALFGSPVYGGRLPPLAAERFRRVKGKGTPAVAVVVYGNRHYDDALLELADLLTENGFEIIAAAAFIAQHSYSSLIAPGRPTPDDCREAEHFGATVREKIDAVKQGAPISPVKVAGNRPYKQLSGGHLFQPVTSQACTLCGTCSWSCPAAAIPADSPNETSKERCIACGRCIKVCPELARHFSREVIEGVVAHLESVTVGERTPDLFI